MARSSFLALVVVLLSCGGDKDGDDDIVPLDADADTDADTDSDTDTDTDADTDVGPCDPLPDAGGAVVNAGDDLQAAIDAAAPGATLQLGAGTHEVSATLRIDKALHLRGDPVDPAAVVLDGGYAGTHLLEIVAGGVTVSDLTLTNSYEHLVRVHAQGADLAGLRFHRVRFLDAGRYGLVVEGDGADHWADDGAVTCSEFALSNDGRPRIRSGCDTGGIDVYGGRGWSVTDSTFDGYWCAFGQSGPAIRAWRGARDTVIERNTVTDSSYGIALGEGQDAIGRAWPDATCAGGFLQHLDGRVVNNLVGSWDDGLADSGEGILVGIRAESSCGADVLHNSVYSVIAPEEASIQHRYPTSTGRLGNNLASHVLLRLEDSALVASGNQENVPETTWYYPSQRDFHLSPAASIAIDQGDPSLLADVPDDVDGDLRDATPDVGADELVAR